MPRDLDLFKRFRTVDGVSIASGDPLVHPEIVRMVAREGLKPIVNTNGLAFTRQLLSEPKQVIRPGDVHANGRQNMCDGCPDITVWDGRLVWSCELEEPERFGDFVQAVPRRTARADDGELLPDVVAAAEGTDG